MKPRFHCVWVGIFLFCSVSALAGAASAGSPGCGGNEEPCCPGDECDFMGLICDTSTGNCVNCGAQNELCCEGSLCGGVDLVCDPNSRCVECGDDEEPCCDGATCNSLGECQDGICEICGSDGMPCCAGTQCDPGSICAPDETDCETLAGQGGGAGECETLADGGGALIAPAICQPCGELGEFCCPGFECIEGFVCLHIQTETVGTGSGAGRPENPFGECVNCGALGEFCCPGDTCDNANLLCGETACEACGAIGEQCCPNETCPGSAAACVEGTCEALEPAPVMGGSAVIGLLLALTSIAALTLKRNPVRKSS